MYYRKNEFRNKGGEGWREGYSANSTRITIYQSISYKTLCNITLYITQSIVVYNLIKNFFYSKDYTKYYRQMYKPSFLHPH